MEADTRNGGGEREKEEKERSCTSGLSDFRFCCIFCIPAGTLYGSKDMGAWVYICQKKGAWGGCQVKDGQVNVQKLLLHPFRKEPSFKQPRKQAAHMEYYLIYGCLSHRSTLGGGPVIKRAPLKGGMFISSLKHK